MARQIFVNLPVADLKAGMAFWRALGFNFNLDYSDDTAACLAISDTIFAMIMVHDKFEGFTDRTVADTAKAREVLIAFSVESRADVDRIADAAAANGGKAHKQPQDHKFMYYRSFADPDGHIWEVTHFPAQA